MAESTNVRLAEPAVEEDFDELPVAPVTPDTEMVRCDLCHRLCGPFQHGWDEW